MSLSHHSSFNPNDFLKIVMKIGREVTGNPSAKSYSAEDAAEIIKRAVDKMPVSSTVKKGVQAMLSSENFEETLNHYHSGLQGPLPVGIVQRALADAQKWEATAVELKKHTNDLATAQNLIDKLCLEKYTELKGAPPTALTSTHDIKIAHAKLMKMAFDEYSAIVEAANLDLDTVSDTTIKALKARANLYAQAKKMDLMKSDLLEIKRFQMILKNIHEYAEKYKIPPEKAQKLYAGIECFAQKKYNKVILNLSACVWPEMPQPVIRMLGLSLYHEKQYELALKHFQYAQQDSSRTWFEMGRTYHALGQHLETRCSYYGAIYLAYAGNQGEEHILTKDEQQEMIAILTCEEKSQPEFKNESDVALIAEGHDALKNGNFKKASTHFSELIARHPTNPDYFHQRAATHLAQRNYQTSLTPGNINIIQYTSPRSILSDILLAQWLRKFYHKSTQNLDLDFMLLRQYATKIGNFGLAGQAQDEILKLLVPKNVNGIEQKMAHLKSYHEASARKLRTRLSELPDDSLERVAMHQKIFSEELIKLGKSALAEDNLKFAIKAFSKASNITPHSEQAELFLSSIYCRMGQPEKALKIFDEALKEFSYFQHFEAVDKLSMKKTALIKSLEQLKQLPENKPVVKRIAKPSNVFVAQPQKAKRNEKDKEAEATAAEFRKQLFKKECKAATEDKQVFTAAQEEAKHNKTNTRTRKNKKNAERKKLKKERLQQKAEEARLKEEQLLKKERLPQELYDEIAKEIKEEKSKEIAAAQMVAEEPPQLATETKPPSNSEILVAESACTIELKEPIIESKLETQPVSNIIGNVQVNYIEHEILARLQKSKHLGFLIGGTLREKLLGNLDNIKNDLDIITSASPELIKQLFADMNVIQSPYIPGLFNIITPEGFRIDISSKSYLTEAVEKHSELNPQCIATAVTLAAKQCDFTINAMFCDADGNVYDTLKQGLKDLAASNLRTVTPADQSFQDDPIRILRSCHFVAKGFEPSSEIIAAIQKYSRLLLSKEDKLGHVNSWLFKLLRSKPAADKFDMLISLGILEQLFPLHADILKKDRKWIKQELTKQQDTFTSLNRIFMIFITSIIGQDSKPEAKNIVGDIIKENPLFTTNYNHRYCNLKYYQSELTPSWEKFHKVSVAKSTFTTFSAKTMASKAISTSRPGLSLS